MLRGCRYSMQRCRALRTAVARARTRWKGRDQTDVPPAAPSLLLFMSRLDGRTHATCVRAADKTECESEQRRSRESREVHWSQDQAHAVFSGEATGGHAGAGGCSSGARRRCRSDAACSMRYQRRLIQRPAARSARAPESASAGEGAKKNLRVTRVSQRARSSRTDVRIAS